MMRIDDPQQKKVATSFSSLYRSDTPDCAEPTQPMKGSYAKSPGLGH
ncbi:hypothetical protein RSSM_05098 [Rhodopirellula sallentina SM41]|uniref:Uncharacterized protein n=1 Tax=Rhodopirellula sallentina SM41 TaxID=1263870 RepID=M5TW96_9BACT|nr:hypothetical protein RSSM_05098 [Rhodopirellula sallentina SM41]